MARKFVWVEAQIYRSVLNGIPPQMPLLIVKRIFTFWIAGSAQVSQMYQLFSRQSSQKCPGQGT